MRLQKTFSHATPSLFTGGAQELTHSRGLADVLEPRRPIGDPSRHEDVHLEDQGRQEDGKQARERLGNDNTRVHNAVACQRDAFFKRRVVIGQASKTPTGKGGD